MSEHTTGTMKPGVSEFLGQEVFTAVPDGNEEKIVAVFGFCGDEDEAESIANVRRFCAAWNACDGLDVDLLARFGLGSATGSEIHRLREQNAELISIIKAVKEWDIEASVARGALVSIPLDIRKRMQDAIENQG